MGFRDPRRGRYGFHTQPQSLGRIVDRSNPRCFGGLVDLLIGPLASSNVERDVLVLVVV